MLKNYSFTFLMLLVSFHVLLAQEIKIFSVSDFDLNGNVKTCTVIKDYGQEIFEFNENGFLAKSTTQYNELDKDIVLYTYEAGELIEKRMESYKDNELDKATSMVNFYEVDTTNNKYIKEKIISFDKEFFEQQEYYFNDTDVLEKIITSHENAVDEVLIDYSEYKNESTQTVFENGVIEKSIRKSLKKTKTGKQLNLVLTKEFVDGEPNKAVERVFSENGKLISEQIFLHSIEEKEFVPSENRSYTYDEEQVLTKLTIKTKNTEAVKEFIFQFDDSEHKNWVKKIITPDNTYVTRRITYYPKELNTEEKPE
ncbi:hypothetical protein [Croceitalea vernalis]|uniref:Uncharacterized protein n=1 Tax=Croceitalea vernalis TaxID=3075599 RepID=A0ABU3BGQ6_9FLAO|nr:hypothetical protein [Croceitalea sp. P007]MDT0621318.1 hypothetical protein [Croceitalea sp. P007]